jgi:hypothetical protein
MSGRGVVLRSTAAGFFLLVALVLAFAAHDVLSWSGQSERADVAVARFSRNEGVWQPHTWLPAAVSRSLLGAGDDVRFGQALQKLQILRGRASPGPTTGIIDTGTPSMPFNPPALDLARLELTFDNIGHGHGRADVRSRAEQLHALLYFQQVLLQGAASGDGGLAALERALADLQEAVRLDPSNDEAQYDLEALLNVDRPIAIERAGILSVRQARRGDTGGGGGSPGLATVAGGF